MAACSRSGHGTKGHLALRAAVAACRGSRGEARRVWYPTSSCQATPYPAGTSRRGAARARTQRRSGLAEFNFAGEVARERRDEGGTARGRELQRSTMADADERRTTRQRGAVR